MSGVLVTDIDSLDTDLVVDTDCKKDFGRLDIDRECIAPAGIDREVDFGRG
jgi:hypothetical protein